MWRFFGGGQVPRGVIEATRPRLWKSAIARAERAPRDWVGSDNPSSSSQSYAEVSLVGTSSVSGHPTGLDCQATDPGDSSEAAAGDEAGLQFRVLSFATRPVPPH